MKTNRFTLYALRLITLLVALSLALTGTALTVTAKKDEAVSPADEEYTQWRYEASTGTLYALYPNGNEDTFTQLPDLSNRIRFLREHQFRYENSAVIDSARYSVYAPFYQSGLLEIDRSLLASKKSRLELESLGEITAMTNALAEYRLYASANYYCSVSGSLLMDLDAIDESGAVSCTLFDLRDMHRYELLGMSSDGWHGLLLGYIFETEEGLYYANALDLPESCFYEDAELLPKTTETLSLIPLDERFTEDVYRTIGRVTLHTPTYDTESSYDVDYSDSLEDASRGLMLATVIILGILLPIAPITLGLCLPHVRSLGYKKRWYLLTIPGGLWLAMGILLLVLLCTVL